ncbi:MAG: single-stranded-DNA-specific exonuclease RecJ, partial [Paludibacteraceae bacterium]|nr:single-stranded-DNA-specific exonuclease RecJ [Paludibacteraceae bacterium]
EQALTKQLAQELSISELSARMLVVRGIRTADAARKYIRPTLDEINDPFLMRDMDKAVARLEKALNDGERILVYGDYDVDGTTAVALMYTFLKGLTDNVDFYIPDRYTEGYGISFKGVDYAQSTGCTLIVALDCGIKAVDKVEYATNRHIDFIVCDHHTPGDELPKAVAVLNMKRADCNYPYKDLSGCGVGFKLVQAYSQTHNISIPWHTMLPLVVMAIASDVVSVTGENRVLAFYGLKEINNSPAPGIAALIEVAGIDPKHVTITDLGFKLGPRINACGRLYSGRDAVELLITDDVEFARQRAQDINSYNAERQTYDRTTAEEALAMLAADPDNEKKHTTVVYSPTWHKGVVGIAASRLTETFYRPTIVLTAGDNGVISGSARSVAGFDIYTAIDSCRDLLTNFGGHQFAAGLSMLESSLPEFKRRFEEYVAAHITEEQQHPTIQVEAEIEYADITDQFFKVLRCLEPFGPGNPRPVFVTRNVINNRYTKRVGKTGEHLRLDVTDRTAAISGIAFGKGDLALHLQNGNAVDICYVLDENVFNGVRSIQMMVEDIKKH